MSELRAAPNPPPAGQRRKLWEVRDYRQRDALQNRLANV